MNDPLTLEEVSRLRAKGYSWGYIDALPPDSLRRRLRDDPVFTRKDLPELWQDLLDRFNRELRQRIDYEVWNHFED